MRARAPTSPHRPHFLDRERLDNIVARGHVWSTDASGKWGIGGINHDTGEYFSVPYTECPSLLGILVALLKPTILCALPAQERDISEKEFIALLETVAESVVRNCHRACFHGTPQQGMINGTQVLIQKCFGHFLRTLSGTVSSCGLALAARVQDSARGDHAGQQQRALLRGEKMHALTSRLHPKGRRLPQCTPVTLTSRHSHVTLSVL